MLLYALLQLNISFIFFTFSNFYIENVTIVVEGFPLPPRSFPVASLPPFPSIIQVATKELRRRRPSAT